MSKKTVLPALCLLTVLLVSCGDTVSETPTLETGNTAAEDVTSAESMESIDPAYLSDLPEEYDLGGYEFVVLKQDMGQSSWQWNIFAPEEESGDLQNDACFARNSRISEQYNCVIREEIDPGPVGKLKNLAAAGDATYSACIDPMSSVVNAAGGSFYDFYDLPNVNLKKTYWNQNMIDALTVRGSLYVLGGDILVTDDDCIEMTLYNHALAADLDMENLYDAVGNGTWTFDKMVSMMKAAAADLNGDSKVDLGDRVGLLYADNAAAQPYFAGVGAQLFKITDGEPAYTGSDDRAVRIFEIMNEIFTSPTLPMDWSNVPGWEGGASFSGMIDNKQVLFVNMCLSLVRRFCRDVEVNFGLLPIPKLDEAQEGYATCIHKDTHGIYVPVSVSDPEKTGFILEALAAASTELSDVYYNVCMASKYTRDAESYDMVRLCLDNIVIDPGFVFDWGGLGSAVTLGIAAGGKEYTSIAASKQSSAEKAMQKFLDAVSTKE